MNDEFTLPVQAFDEEEETVDIPGLDEDEDEDEKADDETDEL